MARVGVGRITRSGTDDLLEYQDVAFLQAQPTPTFARAGRGWRFLFRLLWCLFVRRFIFGFCPFVFERRPRRTAWQAALLVSPSVEVDLVVLLIEVESYVLFGQRLEDLVTAGRNQLSVELGAAVRGIVVPGHKGYVVRVECDVFAGLHVDPRAGVAAL